MRTIRIERSTKIDFQDEFLVTTEVIINDDSEAEEAGREARAALDAFVVGFVADPE